MSRFADHPFIAIWEMTRACDLVCLHCRACAAPEPAPGELTTREAEQLLARFAEVRVPLVVLTGGDPAKRPDLVELVRFGRSVGLVMGLTPSATPLVTPALIGRLAEAGLSRLAVSVDGPDAATHDAFRGVPGSFEHSRQILARARALGIPTQINTTVHAGSIGELPRIAALVADWGSVLWSVFFIVPMGRAEARMLPSAEATEGALRSLATLAAEAPFAVKTTAAPHYRRVLAEVRREQGHAPALGVHGKDGMHVNDGRGFLFISHQGDIHPSGFLPLPCGNVRRDDPIDVYRHHATFTALRDPERLVGKCGDCEYRKVCSGSRARAFAMTGDPLGSDPLCAYVPPRHVAAAALEAAEGALP